MQVKEPKIREYLWSIIGLLAYKISLDSVYIQIISPLFEYADFFNQYSLLKSIVCYLFLIIISPYITKLYNNKNIVFSYLVIFLTLFSFIPNLTIITYNPLPSGYLILWIIYWTLFFLACKYLPYPKVSHIQSKSDKTLYIYLIILSGSVLFVSGVYTGFRLHFNLLDVYGIRAESKEYNYPGIFSYIIPAAGTILPIILLYFLEKKKILLSFLIILVIILNFSIGGHKAVLVSLIVTVIFFFFYRNYMIKLVSWIMTSLGIISIIEYHVGGTFYIGTLFIRRVLFLPAQLNLRYYEFFTTNIPDFFRQSFLRHLGLTSPYKDPLPLVIGELYYGPNCAANNGLFSDAIQNLGIIGIVIFPFLIVMILKLIASFSKGIATKYAIVPCIMISIALLSTTLMTALLTSGIVFVMYLFYVFPRDSEING